MCVCVCVCFACVIIPSDSWCVCVKWLLSWPVSVLLHCTIPDCSLPRWERWYLLTFLSSTLWIALFSYLMVWMVGNTLVHRHTCTRLHTYIQPVPLCFCLGDHNQLHTWNPRSHHGHHFPGSRHQCPWLYGQSYCRPTRCVCGCFTCLNTHLHLNHLFTIIITIINFLHILLQD